MTNETRTSSGFQGLKRVMGSIVYPLIPVPVNFRVFGFEIDIDFGIWAREQPWNVRRWDYGFERHDNKWRTREIFIGPFHIIYSK